VDLSVWQLTAGFLAAVLLIIGVVAFIRYSRPTMLVILGLLIAIPAIGFAAYAIVPGPEPHTTTLLWLAFVPAVTGLGAGVWMLAWMSARREALTFQNIELLSNGTLIAYGGLVLALSDVLGLWQPLYAIANVAVNAAWALAWAPRRWRRSSLITAIEIRARLRPAAR
jgi:Zn-dependent protease with chaperone function